MIQAHLWLSLSAQILRFLPWAVEIGGVVDRLLKDGPVARSISSQVKREAYCSSGAKSKVRLSSVVDWPVWLFSAFNAFCNDS